MSDAELLALANEWLRYAEEDLQAAARVFADDYPARHACWAAQQAAEKAIKALLVRYQIAFPKSHSLEALAKLLPPANALAIPMDVLAELSGHAVEARYPGPWPEATREDAEAALAVAGDIYQKMRAAI